MRTLETIFGVGRDLGAGHMAARALVMFVITVVLVRVSGRRTFARTSAFDATIVVMLGAVLARAVVGASPMIPTITAGAVLVLAHRVIATLVVHFERLDHVVKGPRRLLYADGELHRRQLAIAEISPAELDDALRTDHHVHSLEDVRAIWMERTGELTVEHRNPRIRELTVSRRP
jgi:uncharacterized membrane protein YcaP (DUF421 family)